MFSGKRVRQARELYAWTQSELARRVGLSQGAIAHIEGGFKTASPAAIAAIAGQMQTRFPITFFSSEPPVEISLEKLLFRSHASLMSRGKGKQACRYAEVLYEIASFLQSHIEPVPVRVPSSHKEPEVAARETRASLGLSREEPVSHLLNAVERAGILVLALPLDLQGRDAFSFWIENQPVICVSAEKPGDRVRLSVAHELGHLVLLHHRTVGPENEDDAFRFASELLMPTDAFRRELPSPATLSALAELKPRWRVSIQAIIRRAFNTAMITDRQYRYLFEQLSAKGWRTREPDNLDIPVEKPRALRKMVELVYGNPVDYISLAADLRLTPDYARAIMDGYADYRAEPERQLPANVISFKRA